MKTTSIRLSFFSVAVAGALAFACPADAAPAVGGFAGHAAGASSAACFAETNGGVVQNGCSGSAPAWEVALPLDLSTTTNGVVISYHNGDGMKCSVTSMNNVGSSYHQVVATISNPSGGPGTYGFGGITNIYYDYLYCNVPYGTTISGVAWSDTY